VAIDEEVKKWVGENTLSMERVAGWVKANFVARSSIATRTYYPVITGTVSDPTVTYTTQVGRYAIISGVTFYSFNLTINTFSGGSGDVKISLPTVVGLQAMAGAFTSGADLPGTPASQYFHPSTGNAYGFLGATADNAANSRTQISGLAAGDSIITSGFYWT
jgi:hypothetical protein